MVTTLIAQIVRFARPQYPNLRRARRRPVPMDLCAVSRWREGCRNKGKAQLSSALERISERIKLAFQTLSRSEAIRGSTIDISIGSGGEGVSQSPLKGRTFSTFQGQNPPFELRRKMGFRLRQKPVPPNGPSSTTVPSSDERKANCRRTAEPDRPPVAESDGSSSSSGPALLFPSALDVMKEP